VLNVINPNYELIFSLDFKVDHYRGKFDDANVHLAFDVLQYVHDTPLSAALYEYKYGHTFFYRRPNA